MHTERACALSAIAEAQAKGGDVDEAQATARSIEDAHERAWTLRVIAEEHNKGRGLGLTGANQLPARRRRSRFSRGCRGPPREPEGAESMRPPPLWRPRIACMRGVRGNLLQPPARSLPWHENPASRMRPGLLWNTG